MPDVLRIMFIACARGLTFSGSFGRSRHAPAGLGPCGLRQAPRRGSLVSVTKPTSLTEGARTDPARAARNSANSIGGGPARELLTADCMRIRRLLFALLTSLCVGAPLPAGAASPTATV